jgi:hypothetical protein
VPSSPARPPGSACITCSPTSGRRLERRATSVRSSPDDARSVRPRSAGARSRGGRLVGGSTDSRLIWRWPRLTRLCTRKPQLGDFGCSRDSCTRKGPRVRSYLSRWSSQLSQNSQSADSWGDQSWPTLSTRCASASRFNCRPALLSRSKGSSRTACSSAVVNEAFPIRWIPAAISSRNGEPNTTFDSSRALATIRDLTSATPYCTGYGVRNT